MPLELSRLLAVERGITALIGSGGKTTAMYLLAEELSRRGTVICTTSTHILVPSHLHTLVDPTPEDLSRALAENSVVCTGSAASEGKLTAPTLFWATLAALADYVLVEADGAHRLPCKAHLPHEPVIPPETTQTILLAGASGLGKPIQETAHRPEVFCRLSGRKPGDPITPAALAAVIKAEALGDKVLMNQADGPEEMAQAKILADLLPVPVFAGSLWKRSFLCLS